MGSARRRAWYAAPVLAVLLLSLAALAALGAWQAGTWLVRAAPALVGPPPEDLGATPLVLAAGGGRVAGWRIDGRPGQGAVLLLHGLRSDRRQMTGRARFLARAGYTVLMIDLPAHGESDGGEVTFGRREAVAVEAALAHLAARRPAEKAAVIGVSLGAAAAVYARPLPPPAAWVLESLYPTLADAARNRLELRLGPAGAALVPLLLVQLPLRWGDGHRRWQPVDELRTLHTPLLLIAGGDDRHTREAEARRLHDAAAAADKALWLVPGAGHVDLHRHAPADYEARVLAFLHRHLPAAR